MTAVCWIAPKNNILLTFFDEVLQEVVDGYFSFPPVGYCIILHTIFDPMESWITWNAIIFQPPFSCSGWPSIFLLVHSCMHPLSRSCKIDCQTAQPNVGTKTTSPQRHWKWSVQFTHTSLLHYGYILVPPWYSIYIHLRWKESLDIIPKPVYSKNPKIFHLPWLKLT